ncbi:hypothetical protein BHE74_00017160 [Ensete ventricosum]|nr:hypothetical protein BHE74_00017160 [Ensete ventricosum]
MLAVALKIPKSMAVVTSTAPWATRFGALLAAPARLRISLSIGLRGKHRTLPSSLRRTMASASAATPPTSGVGEKVTAPYGSWKSPITADVVAGADKRLGGIAAGGDGRLVWIESRPEEGGYVPLFTGPSPVPITPDYGGPLVCYADGNFDSHFSRYITVMEGQELSKRICVAGGDPTIVESPTEPKWSPKGIFPVTAAKTVLNRALARIACRLGSGKRLGGASLKRVAWVLIEVLGPRLASPGRLGEHPKEGEPGDPTSLSLGDPDPLPPSLAEMSPPPRVRRQGDVFGSCCLYIEGASATHPLSIVKVEQ